MAIRGLTRLRYDRLCLTFGRQERKNTTHLDGEASGAVVKAMPSKHIFESEQTNVRAQRHLAHTVRVEVELVLDDARKVLQSAQ